MKARTLVFTLLIGLMCFAGFGNTTPDLTDNSTPELFQMEQASENVVMVMAFEAATAFDENQSPEIKYLASHGESATKETSFLTYDNYRGDVGWHFEALNYQVTTPLLLFRNYDGPMEVGWQFTIEKVQSATKPQPTHRNPRDGIRYDLLS